MELQKGSSSSSSLQDHVRRSSTGQSRTRGGQGDLDNSYGSIQTQSDATSNLSSSSRRSGSSIKLAAQQVAGSLVSCFIPPGQHHSPQGRHQDNDSASSAPKYRFTHYEGQELEGSANFSFKEVFKATNNFTEANKIGEGNFGTIYKGKLKDGTTVAVKYAKKNPNEKHSSAIFKNEIKIMSQIEHLNLVKFLGFLEQDDERIIIVEYVGNGNLREHLNGTRGETLEMVDRIQIAIDIAHAITYLHTYTDHPIIHRDIKASNILITEKLKAKVADFGFARLAAEDPEATHVFTQVKGTAGYLDPEYLKTYQLTEKSDVYSFGVLLVELMSGRHSIEQNRPKDRVTSTWAMQKHKQGNSVMVMDPNLRRNPASMEALNSILDLAQHCLETSRRRRPSMKECAEILWSIRNDFQKYEARQIPVHSSTHYSGSGDYSRHTETPDAMDMSSTTWEIQLVRDGATWE